MEWLPFLVDRVYYSSSSSSLYDHNRECRRPMYAGRQTHRQGVLRWSQQSVVTLWRQTAALDRPKNRSRENVRRLVSRVSRCETVCIVSAAGSMKRYGVRLSVCLCCRSKKTKIVYSVWQQCILVVVCLYSWRQRVDNITRTFSANCRGPACKSVPPNAICTNKSSFCVTLK